MAKLEAAGCAAVFMPASLYHSGSAAAASPAAADGGMVVGAAGGADPEAHCTWVTVEHLSTGLCARSRPHFFRGVCTVVAKLFNVVDPDAAFFGKKDYQQWRVLERMARDLDYGVEVVGLPIWREPDGLAMSRCARAARRRRRRAWRHGAAPHAHLDAGPRLQPQRAADARESRRSALHPRRAAQGERGRGGRPRDQRRGAAAAGRSSHRGCAARCNPHVLPACSSCKWASLCLWC